MNAVKLGSLGTQLLADVASKENTLQIHPLALDNDPNVDHFSNVGKLLFPLLDTVDERANETRRGHALQTHGIIIDGKCDVVRGTQHNPTVIFAFHILDNCELCNAGNDEKIIK